MKKYREYLIFILLLIAVNVFITALKVNLSFFLINLLFISFYIIFVQNRTIFDLKKAIKNKEIFYEKEKFTSIKELLQNIAHQYRQPLSVITICAGSIEIKLKKETLDIEEIEYLTNSIYTNVQYLSNILDNFDNLNKTQKLKESFDLEQLKNIFLDMQSFHLKNSNIKLNFEINENCVVYSYKNELLQIIVNIVNNCYDIFELRNIQDKYIIIKASINKSKTKLTISIQDNAGGIEQKDINRIFEPYFTTKHQSQGTGLGLYLSYLMITEKFNGSLNVINIPFLDLQTNLKTTGAKFTVEIPIV